MVNFVNKMIYGGCICIGGINGLHLVTFLINRYIYNDIYSYNRYWEKIGYVKCQLLGIVMGSSMGYYICDKLMKMNIMDRLEIGN